MLDYTYQLNHSWLINVNVIDSLISPTFAVTTMFPASFALIEILLPSEFGSNVERIGESFTFHFILSCVASFGLTYACNWNGKLAYIVFKVLGCIFESDE